MGKVTQKIEANKSQGHRVKVYCERCNLATNHEVLQSVDIEGSEDYSRYGSIDWNNKYQIIQCQGCDTVSFRHLNWCSENMYQIGEDEWENGETEYLYPNRSPDTRSEKTFNNLPRFIHRIYSETVECYNDNSRILCAAGLRAIIEGICSDQNVNDGPVDEITKDGIQIKRRSNLEGKIYGLHEKDILTKASADILHEHRFLGNEALHQLQVPTKVVLGLALDIIEHMLENLYEIPDLAEDLRKKREKMRTTNP